MPDCDICGKPYKSRSGLNAHRKTHDHEPDGLPLDFAPQAPAPPILAKINAAPHPYHDAKDIDDACAALGIDAANILSYRVYPDQVVIIEGPTGFKRTWTRGDHP